MAEFKEIKLSETELNQKKMEALQYEVQYLGGLVEEKKMELQDKLEVYTKSINFDVKMLELKKLQIKNQMSLGKKNFDVVSKQIETWSK